MPFDETTIEDTESEVVDDDTQTSEDGTPDVSSRLQAVEQNQNFQVLMADPEIQEVIKLKREGKVVKVAEHVEEKEEEVVEEIVAEDDPLRETLKRFEKAIDNKLGPIVDRLSNIEGIADVVQKKDVNDQIKAVRDKHEDFDSYKEAMLTLAQDNPGLNVEELYILSRKRAGKLDLSDPSTFSEKPTTTPRTRPGMKKVAALDSRQRGRRGFEKFLRAALESQPIKME